MPSSGMCQEVFFSFSYSPFRLVTVDLSLSETKSVNHAIKKFKAD